MATAAAVACLLAPGAMDASNLTAGAPTAGRNASSGSSPPTPLPQRLARALGVRSPPPPPDFHLEEEGSPPPPPACATWCTWNTCDGFGCEKCGKEVGCDRPPPPMISPPPPHPWRPEPSPPVPNMWRWLQPLPPAPSPALSPSPPVPPEPELLWWFSPGPPPGPPSKHGSSQLDSYAVDLDFDDELEESYEPPSGCPPAGERCDSPESRCCRDPFDSCFVNQLRRTDSEGEQKQELIAVCQSSCFTESGKPCDALQPCSMNHGDCSQTGASVPF